MRDEEKNIQAIIGMLKTNLRLVHYLAHVKMNQWIILLINLLVRTMKMLLLIYIKRTLKR
jgi:hypothetical protein